LSRLAYAVSLRLYLASVVFFAVLAFPRVAAANGSDLPPEIVLQGFVKPEDGRMRLLVRIPLVFLQPFALPKRGPGYLDLAHMDEVLRQAAAAAGRQIELFEDGVPLVPTVRRARISLLSDRSFQSYAVALAHIEGPPLPVDTDLFWNQGFFDAELEYPIRSPEGHFSIRTNVMPGLGARVKLRLQFLAVDGSARALELSGGSVLVALDPRWYEAAWLFVKQGFVAAFAIDRFVFLLCLVAPFRRLRSLVAIAVVIAALQAVTLAAVVASAVRENHWLAPFVDTSLAVAILLLAIGNLGAPSLRRRWFVGSVIGSLGGFGLGYLLVDLLQLGGVHTIVSTLSFNIGAALGEIVSLLLAVAALRVLFSLVLGPALGVVVLSALAGHVAWNWMTGAVHELSHELGHTAEAGLVSATAINIGLWLVPAILVGATAYFLPRRFDGTTFPTLLSALRGLHTDESLDRDVPH
jgi:hypothetical protein